MVASTQESTTTRLREQLSIWSHLSQRPSTSSSGKHLSSTLMKTLELEGQSTSKVSGVSLSTLWPSYPKFHKDQLAQRSTFSPKEWKERIFTMQNQFLWSTHLSNTSSRDTQVKKRSPHQRVSTQFSRKVTEPSTPTQFQLPRLLCLDAMLSKMP